MKRRIAAHWVHTPTRKWHQAVVELNDGVVVDVFSFDQELPFTEWLGGVITVQYDEKGLPRAYHEGIKME